MAKPGKRRRPRPETFILPEELARRREVVMASTPLTLAVSESLGEAPDDWVASGDHNVSRGYD